MNWIRRKQKESYRLFIESVEVESVEVESAKVGSEIVENGK